MFQKLHTKIKRKCFGELTGGIILFHVSARPIVTQGVQDQLNPLTPNDHYSGRTALLTSKRCILYIYSTNIGTEYFKYGIYSPFFLFKMQFVS